MKASHYWAIAAGVMGGVGITLMFADLLEKNFGTQLLAIGFVLVFPFSIGTVLIVEHVADNSDVHINGLGEVTKKGEAAADKYVEIFDENARRAGEPSIFVLPSRSLPLNATRDTWRPHGAVWTPGEVDHGN